MIVAIVKTNNSVEIFHQDPVDLPYIQSIVGGCIEHVNLREAGGMYVNDEGKLRGLPFNAIATIMFELAHDAHDAIVGDVLVVGPIDYEGNETDLTMKGFELISQAVTIGVMRADAEWRRN